MRNIILIISLMMISSVFAQKKMTIYYFGATSCGPCNRPEVVESVNKIKDLFSDIHKSIDAKFVMVCADEDIEQGLKFIRKYNLWDEISVGSFYHNELVLENLNKANIPGMPHILIYEVEYEKVNMGVEKIKSKVLVKDIIGGKEIVEWVNNELPIK